VAVKTFLDLAPNKLREENLEIGSLKNPDFWKEYYQNVQGQIEKINNMLKDLWAASETPTFEFRDKVHLREIVAGVVETLKEPLGAKNLQVTVNIPETLPLLMVDKPKFQRLFDLLLRDEAVTLPAGSRVEISAQQETADGKDCVRVEVHDNGPGLPQEALRLIFDPFVVRSDSPLEYGINLMACYFIVHHHSGRIEAKSEEGQGTTFVLRLPCNPNQGGLVHQNQEFLQKVLLNETVWEKMLASS
jgi:two-component system probable response regulator PhcQ